MFALLLTVGCLIAYQWISTRELRGLASLLLPIDAFDTSASGNGTSDGWRQLRPRTCSFTKARRPTQSVHRQPRCPAGATSIAATRAVPGAQVQLQADLDPMLISGSGCLHLPDPGLHHWCQLRADGAASQPRLPSHTYPLLRA